MEHTDRKCRVTNQALKTSAGNMNLVDPTVTSSWMLDM